MMSILLLLTAQTIAAFTPPAKPDQSAPSAYALVYVGKVVKGPSRQNPLIGHLFPPLGYFKDHAILDAALQEENVAELKVVKKQESARTWLKKSLRVAPLENTGVLRVSFADGSPKEQAAIINAVVKVYLHAMIERDRKKATELIAFHRERHADYTKRLRQMEAELIKLNGLNPDNEGRSKELSDLRQDRGRRITEWKQEVKELESVIRNYQERLRKPPFILLESAEAPESK